jgi:hypothetical protein
MMVPKMANSILPSASSYVPLSDSHSRHLGPDVTKEVATKEKHHTRYRRGTWVKESTAKDGSLIYMSVSYLVEPHHILTLLFDIVLRIIPIISLFHSGDAPSLLPLDLRRQ